MEKPKENLKCVAPKFANYRDWQCNGSVDDLLVISALIVIALREGRVPGSS